MKFKILIIGIITIITASVCCIGGNDKLENNQSNMTINESSNQSQSNLTVQKSRNNSSMYEASGYCSYVVDGDTIDVNGVGRIRFVGVNTPERGEAGYQEAKDFVKNMCLGKTVYLDIDNAKHYDKYGRVLAVVYVNNVNLNAELLKRGYAEVLYIPPSEFNPYSWT
jgi:micrococcal nuclease